VRIRSVVIVAAWVVGGRHELLLHVAASHRRGSGSAAQKMTKVLSGLVPAPPGWPRLHEPRGGHVRDPTPAQC
jgi:hypothetical protein